MDGVRGGGFVVQAEAAHVRFFVVAHQAALREEGLDVAHEIRGGLGAEREG